MAKRIIILRHPEATKNLDGSFSADTCSEILTLKGIEQAQKCADILHEYVKKHNVSFEKIFCAKSERARAMARIIAEKCEVDICEEDYLKSFSVGKTTAGIKRSEFKTTNPEFYYNVKYYDKGLKNCYDIVFGGSAETLKSFEAGVASSVEKIIKEATDDLIVIIMHKSAAMAYIIKLARKYLGYPLDFFGVVPIDTANIFSFTLSGEDCFIDAVNDDISILNEL